MNLYTTRKGEEVSWKKNASWSAGEPYGPGTEGNLALKPFSLGETESQPSARLQMLKATRSRKTPGFSTWQVKRSSRE